VHFVPSFGINERIQEDHGLINGVEITWEKFDLLNQLELCRDFQDPMAIYMESAFSEIQNIVAFSVQSNCSSKYKLPLIFCCKKFILFSLSHFAANKNIFLLAKCLLGNT
jgi:hypothetical protein